MAQPLVYVRTCAWPLLLDQCCDPAIACIAWCSVRSLSGMSDMADRDHIAITSGDASTTRRKFLYRDAQLLRRSLSLRVILAILIVASRQIRKYCPALFAGGPRGLSSPARIQRMRASGCARAYTWPWRARIRP